VLSGGAAAVNGGIVNAILQSNAVLIMSSGGSGTRASAGTIDYVLAGVVTAAQR
jgi:hypothetical protein